MEQKFDPITDCSQKILAISSTMDILNGNGNVYCCMFVFQANAIF